MGKNIPSGEARFDQEVPSFIGQNSVKPGKRDKILNYPIFWFISEGLRFEGH